MPGPTLTTPALPRLQADGRSCLFARLIGLGVAQALLAAAAALGMRWLFDGLHGPASAAMASAWLPAAVAAAGIGTALLQLLLRQYAARWSESLGQRYAAAVRTMLLDHLFGLAPERHQQLRHGHLMARVTGDLAALRRWVGRALAPLLVGSATLLLMVGVVVVLAPLLAAVLVPVLAGVAAWAWRVSIRLEHCLRQERRQRWALAGQMGERLAEAAVVQANAQGARELKRLHRRQQRLHDSAVARAHCAALLQALPAALGSLLLGGAAAWGAWQVAHGQWTAGVLAGWLTLLGLALAPARDLALGLAHWRAWRVSREKLTGFLRMPLLGRGAEHEAQRFSEGALEMGRSLGANLGMAWSMAVPPRGTLALAGPSGSGKSLTLQTLAGLREDAALHMAIDGQVPPPGDHRHLAPRVALVAADLPLLRGSIAGNLRYRRRRATDDELWQALARVGLDKTVAALPRGLAAPVREGGRNLPGVMRARLALARALVGRPVLLLIDDFDLLLEGDAARDQPLAALLQAPPCTLVIATRDERWMQRCAQTLRLTLPVTVQVPAGQPPHMVLVHAA